MYKYKEGAADMWPQELFWKSTALVFMVLAVLGALLALRASKTLECDDFINYEDGSVVCLVTIQGSAQ